MSIQLTELSNMAESLLEKTPVTVISGVIEGVDPDDLTQGLKHLNRHPRVRFLPIKPGELEANSRSTKAVDVMCVKLCTLEPDYASMVDSLVIDGFDKNCELYGVSTEEYKKLTGG